MKFIHKKKNEKRKLIRLKKMRESRKFEIRWQRNSRNKIENILTVVTLAGPNLFLSIIEFMSVAAMSCAHLMAFAIRSFATQPILF